jgi:diguanylate cyclase (GGDEF)-like protein
VEFKEFLELAISKVAEIYDTGFAAIFLLKDSPGIFFPVAACNLEHEGFDQIAIREGEGLLGKHLFARSTLVVDASAKETKELEAFKRAHNVKSLVGFPIFSGKETFGMLIVGNRIDEYAFSSDEIAIVKIFTKQIAIAIENNKLVKKTKELALKDDLTDLFSKNYILPRLDEEIKRSRFYQRPCSFVVINVDDYRVFRDLYGEIASEEALKRIASVVRGYMEPFGKAARIAGDEFALLLPEKNKREALEIAEVIRRKVESITFVDSQKKPLTVSIGVSENPIDGSTHEEVLKSARDFLVKAKEQGKNKVVGY